MPQRRKSDLNGTSRAAENKKRLASESPSETESRLERMSENQRVRLSSESPDERRSRLSKYSRSHALFTENETEQERRERLNTMALNRAKAIEKTRSTAVVLTVDEN